MTLRNPYVDLCLAVQGIRRDCERVRSPLAPAVGVAASVYAHQLANTLRVLSDLRVRHLLADEVGLGKTVQALMILNAVRSERPGLRVLVVVPDQLVTQWRDEILTRAHIAPMGDDSDSSETQYIRLAWEAQLKMEDARGAPKWSLSDIDPANYDVLVVDELHRLRADVQDRIVRAAPAFEHLLVLTATPAFQRLERHAQLFAMLEPERSAIARWGAALSPDGVQAELSPNDDLSKWPEPAVQEVVDSMLERDRLAAESCADDQTAREAAALAHCAYRRVIRTRRADFTGVLPRRRHIPLVTEPLGAEAERQTLMWRYFDYLGELTRQFDPVRLAKRVVLSPPSLEQRVDFLRRKGHDREGLLERVKPLVHRSRGDSRVDALVDLLAEIWRENPRERVLVAAQDNLTVDYLFDAVQAKLPLVGPLDQRVQLVAARVRQGMNTEAVEDLSGYGNETNANLEEFQRGEAQVLFAPDVAQVGLNLQCARVLVLYSVPWRPEEVEQWVGRLDRIGNAAAFSQDGAARTVDVYTIAQRGLVDEKVVTVLQRFRVFEHSVNLDGDHLGEVAHLIETAALRPDSASWRDLEDRTGEMAAQDAVQELQSHLRRWLPWTPSWAKSLHQDIEATTPLAPVLVDLPEHSRRGPRSWDRAFEGMIKLLQRAEEYDFRWNDDPGGGAFRTLWYKFSERGMYGRRAVRGRVIFSFGADPGSERNPRHAHAFITRRGDIGTPPRRSVHMVLGGEQIRRPLHFLNFGNPLHDELVRGWVSFAKDPVAIELILPADHALFATEESGVYFVRISVLDPAVALTLDGVEERAWAQVANAATATTPAKLAELLAPYRRQLRCALEADARWLRTQLPAELLSEAFRVKDGDWHAVGSESLSALLNPMAHGRKGLPPSTAWDPPQTQRELASAIAERLRLSDAAVARRTWGHRFPSFERALALRRHAVLEEAQDAEVLAALELQDAERRLETARAKGNPAQISRAESLRAANADLLDVTRALWAERDAWLDGCATAIRELLPDEKAIALIRVRKAP